MFLHVIEDLIADNFFETQCMVKTVVVRKLRTVDEESNLRTVSIGRELVCRRRR